MGKETTLGELERQATKIPQRLWVRIGLLDTKPNPYAEFVDIIEDALDWIAQDMAQNPKVKQDAGEDQITDEIVRLLKFLTLEASHSTVVGGHCDIVIYGRDAMLWLGEAKSVESANDSYLYKGFEQLNSRYSTGAPDQECGGMIIYCFARRADRVMESWRKYLGSQIKGIRIAECAKNPLEFRSTNVSERTGRDFKVRHLAISFYFDPKDRIL